MRSEDWEQETAEGLADAVRRAFPRLAFHRAVLDDSGGDYRVLVLDGRYAFRFPRRVHHVGLGREIAVLQALQTRCATPTPDYRYVAPDFSFAGYRYLDGETLTPARFATLEAPNRVGVLVEVAAMLAVLHGLEPASIAPLASWPRAWTPSQFAARGLRVGLPLLADFSPSLAIKAQAFLTGHAEETPGPVVVIHGDFVSEHLLIEPDGGRLAGVIDFGDASLGDPAQDFMGLWAYGPGAVAGTVAAYGAGQAAPGLVERSRRAWVRYRIDQVWQALKWEGPDQAAEYAEGLERLLETA